MTNDFIPGFKESRPPIGPAWWFTFAGHRLLVTLTDGAAHIPFRESLAELGLKPLRQQYLGTLSGYPAYAAEVEGRSKTPGGMFFQGLRSLYDQLGEPFFGVAATAVHLVEWDRTNRFCGRCGRELISRQSERAKECPHCAHIVFPRISPAIIVLIERDEKILLARAAHFSEDLYSVLAGFVEPGESLEDAVYREVKEEVGITIKDISYFGSQPWPFPDSLMIGFTAQYAGGDIRIDGKEIVDAGWFGVQELPLIPGKISIARKLIDWFVQTRTSK